MTAVLEPILLLPCGGYLISGYLNVFRSLIGLSHRIAASLGLVSQAARFPCLPLVTIVIINLRTSSRLPKILLAHYLGKTLVVVIDISFPYTIFVRKYLHKIGEFFFVRRWVDDAQVYARSF